MGNCTNKDDNESDIEVGGPLNEDVDGNFEISSGKNLIFKSGVQYQGKVENDKAQGKGKLVTENYTYMGEWADGKPNGEGQIVFKDGSSYKGGILDGKPHGE